MQNYTLNIISYQSWIYTVSTQSLQCAVYVRYS